MKLALLQLLTLTAVVGLALVIGYRPTETHWGAAGISSMWGAAVICWIGATVSAVVLIGVARYAPSAVGPAAFAGTVIRMLVTGALAVGYQMWQNVQLHSFLFWLVPVYLALLVVETAFGVWIVRRQYRPAGR